MRHYDRCSKHPIFVTLWLILLCSINIPPAHARFVQTSPGAIPKTALTINDQAEPALGSPRTNAARVAQQSTFYTVRDSQAANGPIYSFVDATDGISYTLSDEGTQDIQLPFSFNFYGVSSDQVRVGNNGGLLFNPSPSATLPFSNTSLAAADPALGALILPFWDDIGDNDTGATVDPANAVYVTTLGMAPNRQFVVEWFDRPYFNSGSTGATFELILYETTNNIKFQYQDVIFGNASIDSGADATVGIRLDQATVNEYSFNSPTLSDGLAICFQYPASPPCPTQPAESSFVVINTNDSGDGSLRLALTNANESPGPDTITFSIPGSGVQTITPQSTLPFSTEPVIIDGTTQLGTSCASATALATLRIELNGSNLPSDYGLDIQGGNSLVKGLVINGFGLSGIRLAGDGSRLECNYIGINAAGTVAVANNGNGVRVVGSNNTIGGATLAARNVISGNNGNGISIVGNFDDEGGVASSSNLVAGNYIGTDATGMAALGNNTGVFVSEGFDNQIGGGPALRNVISGNRIGIGMFFAYGTSVQGNYIGTDAGGMAVLGNLEGGIDAFNSEGILVGGTTPGLGNVIVGNGGDGAEFEFDFGGGGELLNVAPKVANGVQIAVRGNTIRDNQDLGIDFFGDGVSPNDPSDDDGLQNFPVLSSVTATQIKGTLASVPAETFTIEFFANSAADPSGHGEGDVFLGSLDVTTDDLGNASFSFPYTAVPGKPIITATATDANSNTSEFSAAASPKFVVTTTVDAGPGSLRQAILDANAEPGNTITFNIPGAGVQTINVGSADSGPLPIITSSTIISGTSQPGASCPTPSGPANLLIEINGSIAGGGVSGLHLTGGSSTIHGLIINGFDQAGVLLQNSGTNTVQCNHVGTDAGGTLAAGNGTGLIIQNSGNNLIGGPTAAERNLISGNNGDGVLLSGRNSSANTLLGNYVGTDAFGGTPLANGSHGVVINGAPGNTIGGLFTGPGNVLSGNNRDGLIITGRSASGNLVVRNMIGSDPTGNFEVGNGSNGVTLFNTEVNNIGAGEGNGNVISGNTQDGIFIVGGGANFVEGNFIGTSVSGDAYLGNRSDGIEIVQSANLIGGTSSDSRNVISGNFEAGIELRDATGNRVQGNFIGTNGSGTGQLGNSVGVTIQNGADNLIGGTTNGAGNTISGNFGTGLDLTDTMSTTVQGNRIGTAADGSSPLGNGFNGIDMFFASANLIGGVAVGAGNRIAYNNGHGVRVYNGHGVRVYGNSATGNTLRGNAILANGSLGINLDVFDGVTPNDVGDGDPGPNTLQNFPVLTEVQSNMIIGTLNSTSNMTFTIEFFANSAVDPSGHGEGETSLGTVAVTTDGSGNASFIYNYTTSIIEPFFTATATDSDGNTSEFSAAVQPQGETPTVTETATAEEPTATETSSPTPEEPTLTATNSPTPDDPTPTTTNSPTPDDPTLTATNSPTSIPPTPTTAPTPTATSSPTPEPPTPMVLPTATDSPLPTASPTETATPATPPTLTSTPCPVGWSSEIPYPIPILDNAVVVQNNVLYSFGGVSSNTVVALAYRFDGFSWTAIAPLPLPREHASAVSDGRYIYILGGVDGIGTRTTTMYRYDPLSNSYTVLAAFTASRFAQAAVYQAGTIYLFGGLINTAGLTSEVYTISTNTWRSMAAYPLRVGFLASMVRDGFVYGAGGVDQPGVATTKTYRYDPVANVWDDAAIADLPAARWGTAADRYGDDWLLAGGFVDGSADSNIANTTLLWNALTNSWIEGPGLPVARARMSGATLGNTFFAVGGRRGADGFSGSPNNQRFLAAGCASFNTPPNATATPIGNGGQPTPTRTMGATGGPERAFLPFVAR